MPSTLQQLHGTTIPYLYSRSESIFFWSPLPIPYVMLLTETQRTSSLLVLLPDKSRTSCKRIRFWGKVKAIHLICIENKVEMMVDKWVLYPNKFRDKVKLCCTYRSDKIIISLSDDKWPLISWMIKISTYMKLKIELACKKSFQGLLNFR